MSICELQMQDLEEMVGRDLDGRYVLEKFIDRGSYGAVYRGIDRKFNQAVAIKVGFSSREFMKEARLAAEVRHNHIVQVTDFGSDNGLAYLVMEYLEGQDLEKLYLSQCRALTWAQLRQFVDEIGDALAHAHDEQLIHRDLKPRNIIFRGSSGKTGTSKGNTRFVLLDFGIAAKIDSQGTQRNRTQDGAGTAEYMAPELLTRAPQATPSSDIYAFGVILYQMITGQVPFPQADTSHIALVECLHAVTNDPPRSFHEVASDRDCPAGVEDLVLQCLAKDPADRPQSMAEVRQRFLDLVDTSPGRANAPTDSRAHQVATMKSVKTGGTGRDLRSSRHTSAYPKSSRWLWFGFLVTLTMTIVFGALDLLPFLNDNSTYALLTYEQGTVHGKTVEQDDSLLLEAGDSLRFTFLIEGPAGDVVHFEQPSPPPGIAIETTNGPVPNKSKCFTVTMIDAKAASANPLKIQFHARSANRKQPFEKSFQLRVKP